MTMAASGDVPKIDFRSSSDDERVVPLNPRGMKMVSKKSYVWLAFSELEVPQNNTRGVLCSYVCTLCYESRRGSDASVTLVSASA